MTASDAVQPPLWACEYRFLITRVQDNDTTAMLELIEQFQPLLRKYARLLKAEDAYEILVVDFLEMLHKINLKDAFMEDAALLRYFKVSVHHSYIRHSRKSVKISTNEICLSALSEVQLYEIEARSATCDRYDTIGHTRLHDVLSDHEMKILLLTCTQNFPAAEIARQLGVSRQSVNQTKRRALKKARQYYEQFCHELATVAPEESAFLPDHAHNGK